MQSFRKSSSWHRTTCMLIDNQNFIIFDDIFFVFFIDCLCTKCILDMMDLFVSKILIEVFYLEDFLQFCYTFTTKRSGLGLLIDIIISIFFLILTGFPFG